MTKFIEIKDVHNISIVNINSIICFNFFNTSRSKDEDPDLESDYNYLEIHLKDGSVKSCSCEKLIFEKFISGDEILFSMCTVDRDMERSSGELRL